MSDQEESPEQSDSDFAAEVLQRIADQHDATLGDEGEVYVGDDEDVERFFEGLLELSCRPNDPVVANFEPGSADELAAVLIDAPGERVVRIDRSHQAPCYVWYCTGREEFRSAVYVDDERPATPELGDTGRINPSVWQSYFDRATDTEYDDLECELLEANSLPPLVSDFLTVDSQRS